ncbi:PREDICTED: U6 snRNA-associated Sm-like protein LSm7 [Diuraphis noxia]|uniref:U6 snRNA-associated Sm-like protein LSm7 n=1 Tax=Diuraphis noxia TaxID=143948 RepID=UPI0007635F68|nr:PREDICTED: U6 snRNA-associated Sm-like protein LSm7 [Diuraphis noxia]
MFDSNHDYDIYHYQKFKQISIFRIPSADNEFKMSGKEAASAPEKKKKESILDLTRYLEKAIRVKFSGGREVSGILKGFDPLVNLVLDNTLEYLRDPDEPMKLTEDTRTLGLVVCRGTSIVLICPVDGMEAIANPFVQQD